MTDKDLGVGKTFRAQNKTFKVEIGYNCEKCYFLNKDCAMKQVRHIIPECVSFDRKDNEEVIFVEVEDESTE